MPESEATIPPTSMAFQTLRALWEKMGDSVPPKIDRSFLTGSEGNKTLVLSGLKFLGLVTESGQVKGAFTDLVRAKLEDKPAILQTILHAKYPDAVLLGASNGTHKQLEEIFDAMGASNPDARRKAISFYLHAAKFAGVAVSKYFKAVRVGSTPRAGRKLGPRRKEKQVPPVPEGGGATGSPPAQDHKQRYLDMLLKRVEGADGQLDTALMDRIERLLGMGADDEAEEAEEE